MSAVAEMIHLNDYQATTFNVESIYLHFELEENKTTVESVIHFTRNPSGDKSDLLKLHGKNLELLLVAVDGKPLAASKYTVEGEYLLIPNMSDKFTLETKVVIHPEKNTHLSGLYKSRNNFCTQCEAEGFRYITYFYDRPDVMTKFTTTISADKNKYPMLLSNGNLIEEKQLANNRHWVKWEDPSLKPCYLFALVAGDFDLLQDTFVTMSNRTIDLKLYIEKGYLDQSHYAMTSLKRAMKWDEEAYGREYDLDIYMIVAVSDFNMGAMENKGLNIFNTKCVLAKPETATDSDYYYIEKVIGHEYFHNWSGNRVTCRDWFQITLKEGFTVFRDQSFSADINSAGYERVSSANIIRNIQFVQDSGPMSHPIRPESYMEINNFYTVTVYNKGAEVIRMVKTILGPEVFRKGTDLYFERHDGQAVTTEDFIQVMEDVSNVDFSQFKRWYSQGGTPELTVKGEYSPLKKTYTLHVQQSCPLTPGQTKKEPFHIPLSLGLVGQDGRQLPLQLRGETIEGPSSRVLHITEKQHAFTFVNVMEPVVPSLLRDFSAPVKVSFPYTKENLLHLLTHDVDAFSRWEAGQQYSVKLLLSQAQKYQEDKELKMDAGLVTAFRSILIEKNADKSLQSMLLMLPGLSYLIQQMAGVNVEAMFAARQFVEQQLAMKLKKDWQTCYYANQTNAAYEYNPTEMGRRSLKNICLAYLVHANAEGIVLAKKQFETANNMTDTMGALSALNKLECKVRFECLNAFYEAWKHEALVVDKWLALQATAPFTSTVDEVRHLLTHKAFNLKNPNNVRALMGGFGSNLISFHRIDGAGYTLLADVILELDPINPMTAARVVEPLMHWRHYDQKRQDLMHAELERILQQKGLSKDVYEVVSKS